MEPSPISTPSEVSGALIPFQEQDHGAVLALVAVVAALFTALTITVKLLYRANIKSLREYDYALLAGTLVVLCQSGLAVYAASLGVGSHREAIGDDALVAIAKTQYTLTILGIMVGLCTKMCMCLFIRAINSYSHVQFANRALMGAIITLSIASLFATAFRCPLPSPWWAESLKVCDRVIPINHFVHVASMLTDGLIVILCLVMVVRVQTGVAAKVLIVSLFSIRILCLVTAIPIILDSLYLYNGNDSDFTRTSLDPTIWLIVTSHISIITACIPSLKGIFDSWLGNTFGINIDAPYQLERLEGQAGFAVSGWRTNQFVTKRSRGELQPDGSSVVQSARHSVEDSKQTGPPGQPIARRSRFKPSSTTTLKLTTASPTETSCFSGSAGLQPKENHRASMPGKIKEKSSESVRGLVDGVIVVHGDVDVRFHDCHHRASSSFSSRDTDSDHAQQQHAQYT